MTRRIAISFLPAVFAVKAPEARAMLGGISAPTFRRLVGRGLISKLEGNVYPVADIKRWVEKQQASPIRQDG
jgi:hypothetical protein